jgi:hypothetical protein
MDTRYQRRFDSLPLLSRLVNDVDGIAIAGDNGATHSAFFNADVAFLTDISLDIAPCVDILKGLLSRVRRWLGSSPILPSQPPETFWSHPLGLLVDIAYSNISFNVYID